MGKRKPRPTSPPEVSPEAGLSPEELHQVAEAGRIVYAVEATIIAAGISIQGLTVAGGEGIVVLTGRAAAAARRRAGEVAAEVPGVTEVVNSIVSR